ncbi:hypothetical protein K445DRAFT_366048 [Daldinia sp. EC12]|nr:hypothetical protein K445DRAFT_366048 [Daldinia sp. EC12]
MVIRQEKPENLIEQEWAEYFLEDSEWNQPIIDMVLKDITHVLDCLLRLSIAIANSSPYDQFHYEEQDMRLIKDKFPLLSDNTTARLAKAIGWRRQYMKYLMSFFSRGPRSAKKSTILATGTGDETNIASPESSSNKPESFDASKEVSYWPSIPPLPKKYLGRRINCKFCSIYITINSEEDWAEHVFKDLRPYICLESCPMAYDQFSSRSDWVHHMEQTHWKSWNCSLGCREVFDSKEELQGHMASIHNKDFSESDPEAGNTWNPDKFGLVEGNCSICYSEKIESVNQYYSHIGGHLKQFSLLSLPHIDENEIEMEIVEEGYRMFDKLYGPLEGSGEHDA